MKSINHYFKAISSRSNNYLYKRKGWKTDRNIIVIESDDWGSIASLPKKELEELSKKGVSVNLDNAYNKFDMLASNDDLELLMGVLSSVKDKNNNPAKITLNTIVANPNFEKIKDSNFTEYHSELFTKTLERYPDHNKSFNLWKEGVNHNLFQPQFHGREHANIQLWMKLLQDNNREIKKAFNSGFLRSNINKSIDKRGRLADAYNVVFKNEYAFIEESIREGTGLFEDLFGFRSETTIAPCYTWDSTIEKFMLEQGIKYIQGGFSQVLSTVEKASLQRENIYHYLGEVNKYKQIYLTRNCVFEPSQDKRYSLSRTIKDIDTAFSLKKPAIICSHRLNYIGGLVQVNRDRNLKELTLLLKYIVNRYPNVEFMSSDELGRVIKGL